MTPNGTIRGRKARNGWFSRLKLLLSQVTRNGKIPGNQARNGWYHGMHRTVVIGRPDGFPISTATPQHVFLREILLVYHVSDAFILYELFGDTHIRTLY